MIKKYFFRGENIKITNKLLILLIVLIACIGAVSASDDISDVSDNSTAVSLSYDEQNVDYSVSNVDSSSDVVVANDWGGLAESIANEDSGDSDTVYLTNGTYVFENNTFENSKQINIGTNNIINPTTSINSIMSINLEEDDIIIQQVDDELHHIIYIDGNKNDKTADGLTYETSVGRGSGTIGRFFSGTLGNNQQKNFTTENITMYLADYSNYWVKYTTGMENLTLIGESRNGVIITIVEFTSPVYLNVTFINMTI